MRAQAPARETAGQEGLRNVVLVGPHQLGGRLEIACQVYFEPVGGDLLAPVERDLESEERHRSTRRGQPCGPGQLGRGPLMQHRIDRLGGAAGCASPPTRTLASAATTRGCHPGM